MDTTQESPVIISLCTGIRGLERGLERALQRELTIAAYAEIESFIIANLIAGMESGVLAPAPIWTDLKTFPFAEFHGKVHGIIGGYPCQPFSVAGKQKGTEDPRHLWPYIKAGVSAAQPIFCFFENVRGHLNLGFREVKSDLEGMGYEVRAGIYSAEEVGAPHKRERLFILAVENTYCESIRNNIGELYGDASRTGRVFPNTDSERLPRDTRRWKREIQIKNESYKRRESCGVYAEDWPARPSEYQYEWEAPRTTKSGLGVTINGYNFREDLLRAAGNGVVEQTAEYAFLDLIKKL